MTELNLNPTNPNRRRGFRPAAAALALSGALLLAGCSDSTTTGGDSTGSASASPAESVSQSASQTPSGAQSASDGGSASPAASGKEVYKGVMVSGEKGQTPTVTLTDDFKKVAVLHTEDLWQGEGDPVVDGSTVTVNYVGVGGDSKTVFDSSFERGEPATFPLSQVIEGWSEGLIGMQPGGRRVLVIPGDMAYGAVGNPPAIGPDETLVFVVDLLETTSATPSAG